MTRTRSIRNILLDSVELPLVSLAAGSSFFLHVIVSLLLGTALLSVPTTGMAMPVPTLVKDINTTAYGTSSNIQNFLTIGTTTYFSATDGIHGNELWKTDTTTSGTVLVKDINPGPISSTPVAFANVNGTLFFVANTNEIWKSDGTEAGTVLVKNLVVESRSNPGKLVGVGSVLYFTAKRSTGDVELWKSDGSSSATVIVKGFTPVASVTSTGPVDTIGALTDLNGTMVFTAFDQNTGFNLWRSDGFEAGTEIIGASFSLGGFESNTSTYTREAVVSGGKLYFAVLHTTEHMAPPLVERSAYLYASDGTPGGTNLIDTAFTTTAGFGFQYLTPANGSLFYVFDGASMQPTQTLKIYTPGSGATNLTDPYANNYMWIFGVSYVNSTLVFSANDVTNGFALWKSDGTPIGTNIFMTVGDSITAFTAYNGSFFFRYPGTTALWKTNGTQAGTVLVKDNIIAWSQIMASAGGSLLFVGNDIAHGSELWRSNGTEAGTVMLKDIYLGTGHALASDYDTTSNIVTMNGIMYFSANESINGAELWRSDGTAGGTYMVRDICMGACSSSPSSLVSVNNVLFFSANNGINGEELWMSDGSDVGTTMLKDIYPGSSSSTPSNLVNMNGTFYFVATDPDNGKELWKSDGTATGTKLVKNIYPTGSYDKPTNLTNVNGILFFTAMDPGNATQTWKNVLWKSDGTSDGTSVVKDTYPGGTADTTLLTVSNNTLYFRATDSINGTELWKTNGTTDGTVVVRDIYPGVYSSNPKNLVDVNGTLYFTATDPANGTELWKSNGDAGNTVLVKDLLTGTGSYYSVASLTSVNNTLYFVTMSNDYHSNLWKSNGTAAGTVLVKDLGIANVQKMFNANGTLFFVAHNSSNVMTIDRELWRSDGTASGTVLVSDTYPGQTGSDPSNFVALNNALYFWATDPFYGRELRRLDLSPVLLTTPSYNLGQVQVDTTATQTVTLTNDGHTPLTLTVPATFTGPDAALFSVVPGGGNPCSGLSNVVLTGGKSCDIQVSFHPTTAALLGSKSAILSISSDSSTGAVTVLSFSGNSVIETIPPTVSITAPVNGNAYDILNLISGTAADTGGSLLNRVELQITNGSNYVQQNSQIAPQSAWITTVLDGNSWSFNSSIVSWTPGTWTITAKATDNAGNSATTTGSFTKVVNNPSTLTVVVLPNSIPNNGSATVKGVLSHFCSGVCTQIPLQSRSVTVTIRNDANDIVHQQAYLTDSIGQFDSGSLSLFAVSGNYYVQASYGGGLDLQPSSSQLKTLLVGPPAGYAVIIEGKISGDSGLASHHKSMRHVYRTLKERNFTDDNIYWFNYDDNIDPLTSLPLPVDDTSPTIEEVAGIFSGASIYAGAQTLADRMNTNPAPLYVIMVDHGSQNAFHLDNSSITPALFDGWLTTLNDSLLAPAKAQKKVIIFGACYSGSFIPPLSKAGRIIITSAAASEVSYMGAFDSTDTVQSGEYFIDELFSSLKSQKDIKNAFREASEKTWLFTRKSGTANGGGFADAVQHPLIDDDGNGIGSIMPSDGSGDGFASTGVYLGRPPGINSIDSQANLSTVSDTVYLNATPASQSAPLWAKAIDNSLLITIMVELRRPDIALNGSAISTGQLSRGIDPDDIQTMTYSTATDPTGRYEYNDFQFDQPGRYEAYFYAIDKETGAPSPSRRTIIYKDKAGNGAPSAPILTEPDVNGLVPDPLVPGNLINPGTNLTFRWEGATDPDNDSLRYALEICQVNGCVSYPDIQGTAYLVRDLEPLTSYQWRVWAVDPWGGHAASSFRNLYLNGFGADVVILKGTVVDAATYQPIGAIVTVTNAALTFNRNAVADVNGSYYFSSLGTTGPLTVTTSATGYTTDIRQITIVSQGRLTTFTQNIGMSTAPTTHTVTVTVDGSGNGTVTSTPQVSGSISCIKGSGSNCSASFPLTQAVDLTATRSSGSIFAGWGGDCSGRGTCNFSAMTTDKNVTATFNTLPPFYLFSSGSYLTLGTLQEAYDATTYNAVLQLQATIPAGGLLANPSPARSVTLQGGYDADFTPNPPDSSYTTIQGAVTLRNGTLRVQRIKIR